MCLVILVILPVFKRGYTPADLTMTSAEEDIQIVGAPDLCSADLAEGAVLRLPSVPLPSLSREEVSMVGVGPHKSCVLRIRTTTKWSSC